MADAEALLAELGFGEYEARAYLALLGREPVNGYELAKLSGVPRGNIYGVLQKLEDRGAAVHMDTPAGARYAALPVSDLLASLERRYKDTLTAAAHGLTEIATPGDAGHVWNLEGYSPILEQARSLLANARERLLIAIWPQEARALAPEIQAADERGLAIGTLCLAGCGHECGACRGSVHRYRLTEDETARSLVIVADEGAADDLLAIEIVAGGAGEAQVRLARGIRTRQRQLVGLAASYIRHSIALAAVLGDLGPRVHELISNETRRAMARLLEPGESAGWLAGLRLLLPGGAGRDVSATNEPGAADRSA